jgi:micrococcal nuclease
MKKGWVILIIMVLCSRMAIAEQMDAKVVAIIDGNTLEVKGSNNETYTIMLADVDCPELEQEFGDVARRFLEKIALGKKVKVEWQGKDRRGNRLALVMLEGDVDLRVELLEAGLAWTAERNALPDLEIVRLEAKEKGKGLWKSAEPVPPWIFRRQQTLLQQKGS